MTADDEQPVGEGRPWEARLREALVEAARAQQARRVCERDVRRGTART